jgi:hypothetical protein
LPCQAWKPAAQSFAGLSKAIFLGIEKKHAVFLGIFAIDNIDNDALYDIMRFMVALIDIYGR